MVQQREKAAVAPSRPRHALPQHARGGLLAPHHSQVSSGNSRRISLELTSSRWRLLFLFFSIGSVVICVVQVFGLGHQLIQWHQEDSLTNQRLGDPPRLTKQKHNRHQHQPPKQQQQQPKLPRQQQPKQQQPKQPRQQQDLPKQQKQQPKHDTATSNLVLTAYLEPPSSWQIENVNEANVDYDLEPPRFIQPLPRRTTSPDDLIQITYPNVVTCDDIPAQWPVDCGPMVSKLWTWNATWEHLQQHSSSNNNNNNPFTCPVVGDAFLPWIHDVVVNDHATHVHIVAQNYGRCHTGSEHRSWLDSLQPQGALLQPVSVQRIPPDDSAIPSDLWKPPRADSTTTTTTTLSRYRLAPREQSDADGQATRFICRFHAHMDDNQKVVHIEETLSVYPFDYEFMDYRRFHPTLLHPLGKHQTNPLTSTLLFDCPIPSKVSELLLQQSQATPTNVYLDLVPIRTPPRYGVDQVYLTEQMAGPKSTWHIQNITNTSRSLWRNLTTPIAGFDPVRSWGKDHVLPAVEASGRWANIPLCRKKATAVSRKARQSASTTMEQPKPVITPSEAEPRYVLTACTWVSASYQTRSMDESTRHQVTDAVDRLKEWLEFHLMVGVDHMYVYDNSNAADNNGGQAIQDAVKRWFSPKQVTYVNWPHQVCNNRPAPPVENAGERSSQYAAEASCRMRYGPQTKWMISSLDVDEYLIPIYPYYSSLQQLVKVMDARNQTLLSFRSTRAKLRYDGSEALRHDSKASGREKLPNKTFLEAYNCDSVAPPKPETANRARKEIYRTDSVLYHFVHYSLVTLDMTKIYSELGPQRYEREVEEPEFVPDEEKEAIMLHTKTPTLDQTRFYQRRCHLSRKKKFDCIIGFPWPYSNASSPVENTTDTSVISNAEGFLYNCFPIQSVDSYWKYRLAEAMEARRRTNKEA